MSTKSSNRPNVRAIIGGLLVALSGLMAIPDSIDSLGWIQSADFPTWLIGDQICLFISMVGGLVTVAASILGNLINIRITIIAGFTWFFLRIVLFAVLSAFSISTREVSPTFEALFIVYNWQMWLSFVSAFFALIGAMVAISSQSKEANQTQNLGTFGDAQATSGSTPVQPKFDAMTGQPITPVASAASPGWYLDPAMGTQRYWDGSKFLDIPNPTSLSAGYMQPASSSSGAPGLAVAAFVTSLFFPLIGLILGYVAKNQSTTWPNPLAGAGLIKAAIVIGWVFTILGAVGGIIWGVAFAIAANSY